MLIEFSYLYFGIARLETSPPSLSAPLRKQVHCFTFETSVFLRVTGMIRICTGLG